MSKKKPKHPQGKDYPLVIITWFDAFATDWWLACSLAQKLSPLACVSAGFLIKQDDDYYTICQTFTESEKVTATITIPTGMVKEVIKV